jgi:hypothetical protein
MPAPDLPSALLVQLDSQWTRTRGTGHLSADRQLLSFLATLSPRDNQRTVTVRVGLVALVVGVGA